MNYSPSIYKLVEGSVAPVPLDMEVVRAVLTPYDVGDPDRTTLEDGSLQYRVRAADASARTPAAVSASSAGPHRSPRTRQAVPVR